MTTKIFLTSGITLTFFENDKVIVNGEQTAIQDLVMILDDDEKAYIIEQSTTFEGEDIYHEYYLPRGVIAWIIYERKG